MNPGHENARVQPGASFETARDGTRDVHVTTPPRSRTDGGCDMSAIASATVRAPLPLPAENIIPADSARDSRDSRDTAKNEASGCPSPPGQTRDNRDKPRFELVEEWGGPMPPGVYWIGPAKGNQLGDLARPLWVCDPLKIEAATRDDQDGEWGRLLLFKDMDGKSKSWAMPQRFLSAGGEELRSELLAAGLRIAPSAKARAALANYLFREHPKVRARCVSRTGWHGDSFVLPRETLGPAKAERFIFQSPSLAGVALGQAGTLEGWREHVCAPCAGNSRLVLPVSTGFAALCLGLLGLEGGGLHLRGSSSTGKTTALQVAASLFGPPGFMGTWRHTDNALEGVAALHSDLLLPLDELSQLDPRHAGQVAYLLANGQGKGRAHRDGSPRPVTTWRTLFLSAGEVGLADLVTEGGGKVRAGQQVRVLDIAADAGAGLGLFEQLPPGVTAGQFSDALKCGCATNYGHAMPAFLRKLVADPAKARTALRTMADKLAAALTPPDATGQVRRAAARFALIGSAGELATLWGLTGWATGEAERAARTCFQAWMDGRGTTGAAEPAAMLAQVRAFLEQHGESRFTPWDADAHAPRTVNRCGFRRPTDGGPEFYVERESFRTEICKGFDPAAVARVLADHGALMKEGGNCTRKERLPDGRHLRVYRIGPAIWEATP